MQKLLCRYLRHFLKSENLETTCFTNDEEAKDIKIYNSL